MAGEDDESARHLQLPFTQPSSPDDNPLTDDREFHPHG